MDAYFLPISTAAWQFPIIAALLTLPYAIYSYRKYGAVSAYRSLVLFSMLFYLQCVFYLVILPLPDPDAVAAMTGPYVELVPFKNVYEFIVKSSFDVTRASTWLVAIREPYFLEPAFNLLLIVPFGVYLAYYFKCGLRKVILFSFLLSLFCELTQLTGLFFLYPRPYRLFDVNDLILNTTGGACGYFIYARCLMMLPSKRRIDEMSRIRSEKVGFIRRFIALTIDSFLISAISVSLTYVIESETFYLYVPVFFAYYIAFACAWRGGTPGKAVVKIRIESARGGPAPPSSICARYAARNAFALALQIASRLRFYIEPRHRTFVVIAVLLAIAFAFIDMLLSFRRERRLWYEMLSGTRNVSYFGERKDDAQHTDH